MKFKKISLIAVFILAGIVIFPRLQLLTPLQGISFSRLLLADKGEELRWTVSLDDKYRLYQPLEKINPRLVQAVVLLEDKYFFRHWGVNPVSLVRAAFSLNEARPVGASTITMQLVRLREGLYTKSLLGKIRQILWAIAYECMYSKKQILEAYLNLAPYGANIEGVEAASRIYFRKSSENLDLAEALTLAVIPQNPVRRSLNSEDQSRTEQARKKLAEQWSKEFPADAHQSLQLALPVLSKQIAQLPFLAPHFAERIFAREPFVKTVPSTLSFNLQREFESKLQSYVRSQSYRGVRNGGAILVDLKTREIKAWVGSADYFNPEIQGQIDAITIKRSPGSALKPFLYGLAIDEGLINSETLMKDVPSSYGPYDPENFDRSYKGPLSAQEALIQSRNVPAVELASKIKRKTLYQLMEQGGVRTLKSEKEYGLSIALGSAEVTPEELAGLYTALGNEGVYKSLKYSRRNEDEKKGEKLLSPESTFVVLKMLTENPRSESLLVDEQEKYNFPIAWKTGTSFGFRDAWTAGVVGNYALVVWLGNFDYSSNPAFVGRELAAPLFFQLVDLLPRDRNFQLPNWSSAFGLNLKKVKVCSLTGEIPNQTCPHHKWAYFIPGVSPIKQCDLHREVIVSAKTGRRLCIVEGNTFQREVFEFWPSDILQVFQRMGLKRRSPPAWEEGCNLTSLTAGGNPEIVSPKNEVDYLISYRRSGMSELVPLKAVADAQVKQLSWFIDKKLVGKSAPDETLTVPMLAGKYEVIVVDDHGRSAARPLNVRVVQ